MALRSGEVLPEPQVADRSTSQVAESIRSCASTPGKHISLRGGDGGGAGFEAYLPWNVTNPEGLSVSTLVTLVMVCAQGPRIL